MLHLLNKSAFILLLETVDSLRVFCVFVYIYIYMCVCVCVCVCVYVCMYMYIGAGFYR
jgi:hypothetical protein